MSTRPSDDRGRQRVRVVGMNRVAVEVDDLEAALGELRKKGLEPW